MIIDFLHKFTTEKYIYPKYNKEYRSKGYWYFDFDKNLLIYNWENGNHTRPKGPYPVKLGTKDFDHEDMQMYVKFFKEWSNAHKTSP